MAVHAGTDLQMVMFGKTGVGKSSTGNTISGWDRFRTESGSSSVTRYCQKQSFTVEGRRWSVVDTPDYFYSTFEEDLRSEIEKSVTLCSPGIHAFLIVLKPSTFTEQEEENVERFEQSYGEEAFNYTIILFTHGDQLNNTQIQALISRNQKLQNLVNRCGGRFHLLNNKDPENRRQVTELLQKIDSMVSGNGNRCYTLEMLREAERREEQLREIILEEQRREREREETEHPMNIDRAIRETEERVRRELQEMEEEFEFNNYSTLREDKAKCWSSFQLKYFCVVFVFFSLAGGCLIIWSKDSAEASTFFSGCIGVGVVVVVGFFTGKLWVLMLKSPLKIYCTSPQEYPMTSKQCLKKIGGVLCGGIIGVVIGYMYLKFYILDFKITVLTGLAGGTAAFTATLRIY